MSILDSLYFANLAQISAEIAKAKAKAPRTLDQLKNAIASNLQAQSYAYDIGNTPSVIEKMVDIIGDKGDAIRDMATAILVHDAKITRLVPHVQQLTDKINEMIHFDYSLQIRHEYLRNKYNDHLEQGHSRVRRDLGPQRNRRRYRAWARRR